MKAIIYHTANCVKCKLTARQLKMDTEMRLLDDYPDVLAKLKLLGIRSVPYCLIESDGRAAVDSWSDFNIDKIHEWNQRVEDTPDYPD